VGDAVLETGRYKGGDRQYQANDLVGDRTACVCNPHPQANEQVAQHPLEEQCHEIGTDLCDCRIQYRQPNAAAVHIEMVRDTTRTTRPRVPTRLPQYTIVQLRSTSRVEIFPLAQAITIRLLPVNNSAPPTRTIARPSENTSPPTTRTVAKLKPASLATIV